MKLRSCARCGCHAVHLDGDEMLSPDSDGFYYVVCADDECKNPPAWGKTEDEAGQHWNDHQNLLERITNNGVSDE